MNLDAKKERPIPGAIGPYKFRGVIGEGAFSVVKIAMHSQTKTFYACKVIPKSVLHSQRLEERFESEIRINQQLHHPGIVEIVDLLKDENNYYVIMEYCPNGELFQHIVSQGKLTEEDAANFMRQILEALAYCHSHGIAHRDLKPENLLLDPMMRVKISDFGLSKYVGESGLVTTPCGSPCYASPECLSGSSYDARASDMWSVGVILYAMVTGNLPWTKRNRKQMFEQIQRGEYTIPTGITDECAAMIMELMARDPTKRLTVEEALEHPFMYQADQLSYGVQELTPVSLKTIDAFFERDTSATNMEPVPESSLDHCISTPEIDIPKTMNEMLGASAEEGASQV